MTKWNLCMVAVLLVAAMSCDTNSRVKDASTDPYGGGPSAYDDASTGETALDSEEQIREDQVTSVDLGDELSEGDVDSERLDIPNSLDPEEDLNWQPVHFGFDQAVISAEDRERLAEYADLLKANPNLRVLLEGHCDSRGTEAYNQALGERRATAVERYLLGLGVSPSQLTTISYGELKPINPRDTESAWAENRRVSFTF